MDGVVRRIDRPEDLTPHICADCAGVIEGVPYLVEERCGVLQYRHYGPCPRRDRIDMDPWKEPRDEAYSQRHLLALGLHTTPAGEHG